MDKRRYGKTLSACLAGVFNQAVITNVTALLFVPLADLYGFTFAQLGLLTAINFAAQMLADGFLMLFIGRFSHKKLAVFAAAVSCAGLLFYGGVPFIFSGGALYGGIAGATAVFAFAGGMLEVVLNAVADRLPEGTPVTICFLHTAYAWAQAGLALLLFGCIALFGTESWHYAMFVLAFVPLSAIALLSGADMPEEEIPVKKEHSFFAEGGGLPPRGKRGFGAFYVFALAAIFFGYGSEVCMNQWVSTLFSETAGGGGYVGEFFGAAAFAVCLGLGGLFYVRLGSRKKASRSALFFSALAVFVCFLGAGGLCSIYLIIGVCYYFHVTGFFMIVLVVLAIACYAMTLGPCTWVLISELFPNRVRAVAVATCTFALWVGSSTLTYTFPLLNTALGSYGTFWIYSGVCLAGLLFFAFRLPETKGKSLEELEKEMVG